MTQYSQDGTATFVISFAGELPFLLNSAFEISIDNFLEISFEAAN